MNKVDELLEYVQKTNAEMTREKLLEELGRNPASTICLLLEFATSRHEGYVDNLTKEQRERNMQKFKQVLF